MKKKVFLLILFILAFLSLVFHFSDYFYQTSLNDGQYLVRDPDSLFFLRLYDQSLLRGETLKVDEYGCYPNFRKLEYPPFHLQLLQGISLLAFTFFPDFQWTVGMLIGWLPPVAGWLIAMFMIYFAWRKTADKNLTLLVAFASIPGSLAAMNSLFLKIDYTFLSHFFIWSWILGAWLFIDTAKRFWAFGGTIIVAAFLLTWPGIPLFFFMVTLYAVLLLLDKDEAAEPFAEYCFRTMTLASLPVFFYLMVTGEASTEIGSFGYFQPAAILVGGVFLKLALVLNRRIDRSKVSKAGLAATVAGSALICVAVLFVFFYQQVRDGISFFFVSDVLMKSVSELKPGLNFSSMIKDPRSFFNAIYDLSILFILFPFVLKANPFNIFSKGGRLIKDFSMAFLLMGFFTVRYYAWLGTVIGFWAGLALYAVFSYSRSELKKSGKKPGFSRVFTSVAAVLLPFMLMHFVLSYPIFFQSRKMTKETVEAMRWIKENTPPTSGYFDQGRPEYCFYTFWSHGNILNYYAQRPTVVNNAMWGYGKMAAIFTAESEAEAYRLCEKYGVRYFYIDYFRNYSDEMVRYLSAYKKRPNLPEDNYLFFPEFVDKPERKDEFDRTFHFWLSDRAALVKTEIFKKPASRLRMIFCSGYYSKLVVPKILIYEMVKGANIQGKAPPDSLVELSLTCKFQKIDADYKVETRADENGNFSFLVPYSTGYSNGNVTTGASYHLSGDQTHKAECVVSEQDVKEGKTVTLTF